MTQARIVSEGGNGKLVHGKAGDDGVLGHLYSGINDAVNSAVCGLFGSHFLPTVARNNHCPEGSFASNTFESFGNLCECLRCKPDLRNCITSAALTLPLAVSGVSDVTLHLGECCNIDPVRFSHRIVLCAFEFFQ